MTKPTVTTADLRAYFNADPKRLAALSPEARKTVEKDSEGRSPKGRVHPEARALHNQRRKVQYVEGATATAKAAQRDAAKALRASAAAAGVTVGKRGPLPKAALAAVNKG